MAAIAALARWRAESDEPWQATGEWSLYIRFFVGDLRRRDIDNLEKNLLDGLNGTVFDDDNQVVRVEKEKRLSRSRPRVEVTVERVTGFLTED